MKSLLERVNTDRFISVLFLSLVVLAAFFILPLGNNPLETSKIALLLMTLPVVLMVLGVDLLKYRSLRISLQPLLLPIVGLLISTLVSGLLNSSQVWSGLSHMTAVFSGGLLIALLGSWLLHDEKEGWLPLTLGVAGSILTILTTLELFKVSSVTFYNFLLGSALPSGLGFSPAGSVFVVAQLTLVALVTTFVAGLHYPHKRQLFFSLAGLNLLGFAIAAWSILPGKPTSPIILPWTASWSIAVDMLRNPRTALIGVGPNNFVDAYNLFKPLWLNTTNLWNIDFGQASSTPFNVFITQGLIGFGIWLWLVFTFVRHLSAFYKHSPVLTALNTTLLAVQLVVPPTPLMTLLSGISLAYLLASLKTHYPLLQTTGLKAEIIQTHNPATWFHWGKKASLSLISLLSLCLAFLGIALVYLNGRVIAAEYKLHQANQQAALGDVVKTYELQQQAINLNPYHDGYHRQYALTNLSIALALSNKSDLTDDDRNKVTQLIQQSIREARATTVLNPQRAQNWEVLGDIYSSLIGTASGAETWSADVYQQALNLSPHNANLYIKLGGIFYGQENYRDAILLFDRAAQLKPDLVNAYYNAANALVKLQEYDSAENVYRQTLTILERTTGTSSEEYVKTSQELEAVQKLKAEASAGKTPTSTGTPSTTEQNNTNLSVTEENLIPPQNDTTSQGLGDLNLQ